MYENIPAPHQMSPTAIKGNRESLGLVVKADIMVGLALQLNPSIRRTVAKNAILTMHWSHPGWGRGSIGFWVVPGKPRSQQGILITAAVSWPALEQDPANQDDGGRLTAR